MEKRCFSFLQALIVVSLHQSSVIASVKRGTSLVFMLLPFPPLFKTVKSKFVRDKEQTKKTNPIQKIPHNLLNFSITLIEKNHNKRLCILWQLKGNV